MIVHAYIYSSVKRKLSANPTRHTRHRCIRFISTTRHCAAVRCVAVAETKSGQNMGKAKEAENAERDRREAVAARQIEGRVAVGRAIQHRRELNDQRLPTAPRPCPRPPFLATAAVI